MQVSSSVNAGYYNSYENRMESTVPPGYENRIVRKNTAPNSFAEETNHVAQAGGSSSALVLHGADEESGDTLVSAWADNVDDFSVGVIGGADGPTSIFIAGKLGTPWGLYIATVVVIIVTIVYFVKKRRR